MIDVVHYDQRTAPMTVKEWLSQVRTLDASINAKMEEVTRLRALWMRCTQQFSGSPTAGGRKPDWADTFARIEKLENDLNVSINRLTALKSEILHTLEQVQDPELRLLLELRYIRGCSWTKICAEMAYERAQIFRKHKKALIIVENVKDDTK